MAENEQIPPTLDHNGALSVTVHEQQDACTVAVDLSTLQAPEKLGGFHFCEGLRIVVNGAEVSCTPTYDAVTKRLEFHSPDLVENPGPMTLELYGQPLLTLQRSGTGWVMDPSRANERLLVDEIREISDYDIRPEHLPYDRSKLKGFNPEKHAPITDVHTHSSAQVSAKDLMQLALGKNLDYPVELLEKLNIELSDAERKAIKADGGSGSRFSPCESEGLKCEQQGQPCDVIPLSALSDEHRARIEQQLKIPLDKILCFSDFDRAYYRFVNPIVKNPSIARDMILKIAEDYQRQGVRYAELSTASMLNLNKDDQAQWFKEMSAAVAEAEAKTGVTLRFLVGLPRNYSTAKAMAELEKIKHAARHPLIAGVDLLGYEFNRTEDFSATFANIAQWARDLPDPDLKQKDGWDFKRDFVIRIHAGETGKNDGNVASAVGIAKEYGVPVRIAHAVNQKLNPKLDADIKRLSEQDPPLVQMEFCAPSNIAYNNTQDLTDVPYERWFKACKRWFLGSDGAGAIQTTPTQMAISALYGGVTLDDLAALRGNEERYIDQQKQRYDKKTAAFNACYPEGEGQFLKEFAAHVKAVNDRNAYLKTYDPPPVKKETVEKAYASLPEELNGKEGRLNGEVGRMPVMIAGASGNSMEQIDPKIQKEIKRSMRMLVASLDPEKAYFVVGRAKPDGVTAALDEAVLEYNEKHPKNKFDVVSVTTADTKENAYSITHTIQMPGGIDQVPDNLIGFMKYQAAQKNLGISVFIGGSNFSSDMIRKSKESGLPYLLMESAEGASMRFAKKVKAEVRFNGGVTLLQKLHGLCKSIGREVFGEDMNVTDTQALDALARKVGSSIKSDPCYVASVDGSRQPSTLVVGGLVGRG